VAHDVRLKLVEKVALVAGASGVTGRALFEHFDSRDDWQAIGLASKLSEGADPGRFVAMNLLDPDECARKAKGLGNVTHVFFAAYREQPTEAAQVATNGAMLRNLMIALEAIAAGLRHVNLIEGTKAYGCHFGPFKTPARETDPRHLPPNFYYDQEDFLIAQSKDKSWSWSALRPDLIMGPSEGYPMNLLMAIAVYAAICKEIGVPLAFPGTRGAYAALFDATDATHLARAAEWSATDPGCAGEVFNITNGDLFRWEHLWPRIASMFGMEPGPPTPLPLGTMMSDKGPLWDAMIAKYGLRPTPLDRLVSWGFAEFVFRIEYDVFADTTKARRFGFHHVVETEAMFDRMFRDLRRRKLIP
jgi:nucleoside-diphosphate-sugar epimerase